MLTLYKDTDTLIRWDEMKDERTGNYVNNATVRMTLEDDGGNNVSGAVNLPMAYVAGSNGRYHGTVNHTISLTIGREYVLVLTATSGTFQTIARVLCQVAWYGEDN